MVVVVIIGVLVAIAIPIYGTITEGAERGAVEANLRTIDSAIMQYQAAQGMNEVPTFSALEGEYFEPIDPARGESYHVDHFDGSGVSTDTDDPPRARVTGEAGGQSSLDAFLPTLPW